MYQVCVPEPGYVRVLVIVQLCPLVGLHKCTGSGKRSYDVMAAASGLMVCFAWYYTILAGFYLLYCPALFLMLINHRLFRQCTDTLFAVWELFPVALFQWCCNTQLHHYGDFVNPDENTILIMNHRTRVDWNYVWIALYHATQNSSDESDHDMKEGDRGSKIAESNSNTQRSVLDKIAGGTSKLKFVLKDEIKTVPGLGWIMQLNFFLYVKRDWREDQLSLFQFTDYYRGIGSSYRVVLFPEGTDLSVDNRRKSDRFAVVNNLPHLNFLLHPRTTGWVALCSRLRAAGLVSVYDVTVAYDTPAQTEADLLRGLMPGHVHFHVKRYPINQVPGDEDSLKDWLTERWRDKDISLRTFHNNGNFFDVALNKVPTLRSPKSLTKAKKGFVFWCLVDLLFFYGMCCSSFFQFWVIFHTILFVLVTWRFGGFHKLQYKIFEKNRQSSGF